jgi:hypothetical protein
MTLHDQLTAEELARLAETIAIALEASRVPHHLRGGLHRYFVLGILPGGFLQACLINDLRQAISRGDPSSIYALPAIVEFLQWEPPGEAWGSRLAVLQWTTTPERLEV